MHGIVTDNESTRPSNGLYEVKLEVSMNKTQIVVPANINCLLEIPATEYMRERTETYNGEILRFFMVVLSACLLHVDYSAAVGDPEDYFCKYARLRTIYFAPLLSYTF